MRRKFISSRVGGGGSQAGREGEFRIEILAVSELGRKHSFCKLALAPLARAYPVARTHEPNGRRKLPGLPACLPADSYNDLWEEKMRKEEEEEEEVAWVESSF